MVEIGNSLDGTVEKAISATEKLNGLPKFVQKFALAGDFSLGSAKKNRFNKLYLKFKRMGHFFVKFLCPLKKLLFSVKKSVPVLAKSSFPQDRDCSLFSFGTLYRVTAEAAFSL